MTFRIGVIGVGIHGARYLKHATADVEGMVATAICRRDAEAGAELARQWHCSHHQEPESLIADPQVDGVIVCTPPASHYPLARTVLAAGKPLLLEKPMTGTLAEARMLKEMDDSAAAPPLMVAQTLRWNPVLLKVRDLWPQLGPVHLVRVVQRLAPTNLAWQRDLTQTVGGSVLLTGVHLFDTVRWLTGAEFIGVDSRQTQILNPVVEDLFLARGHLSDGCWVNLEVSKYTDSRGCWLEAVGEHGQLQAEYCTGGILLRKGYDETRFEVSAAVPTLPLVLAEWQRAAQTGSPPPVTVVDGLATLQVVDACYRSAADVRTTTLVGDWQTGGDTSPETYLG